MEGKGRVYECSGGIVPGGVVEGTAGAVELEDGVGGVEEATMVGVGGLVEGAVGVGGWGIVRQGGGDESGEEEEGCCEGMHWRRDGERNARAR